MPSEELMNVSFDFVFCVCEKSLGKTFFFDICMLDILITGLVQTQLLPSAYF